MFTTNDDGELIAFPLQVGRLVRLRFVSLTTALDDYSRRRQIPSSRESLVKAIRLP
jgi:hypothetical protein